MQLNIRFGYGLLARFAPIMLPTSDRVASLGARRIDYAGRGYVLRSVNPMVSTRLTQCFCAIQGRDVLALHL